MDEGETLPLLSATATAARASRDADGAPIRSAGLASCSGRGSTKKKTSRWLATLGAASLGALLLAGAAVGRGGLDGNLHFTSLGEAARGAARARRHEGRGGGAAHASRARAASSGLGDTTLEPRGIGQMPRAEPIRPPQERAADRQRARREERRRARSAEREAAAGVGRRAGDGPTPDDASGTAGDDETVTTPSFVSGDDPSAPSSYETRKVLDPLAWRMNIESEIAVAAEKAARAAAGAELVDPPIPLSAPMHAANRFAWKPKLGVDFVDADELAARDALGANERALTNGGADVDVVDYARSHEAIVEFEEEERERRRRDRTSYADWLKSEDGIKAVTTLIPFPDFVAERAEVPGLVDHVNDFASHNGQQLGFPDPEKKKRGTSDGFDEEEQMEFGLTNLLRRDDDIRIPIDDLDLRWVTYATHEYWPMVKTLVHSMERNAPDTLLRLTVMLTDEDDLTECRRLSKAQRVGPFSCFLDYDVLNIMRREERMSNDERYNRDTDDILRSMYEQMAEGWGASASVSAGLGGMGSRDGGKDRGGGGDDDLATLGADGRITPHAADMLRAMNRTQLVDAIVDLQSRHNSRVQMRHDGTAEIDEKPAYVRDWVDDVTDLGFIAIPAELADEFETRQKKPEEPSETLSETPSDVDPIADPIADADADVARVGLSKRSKSFAAPPGPKRRVRQLKKNALGFVELPKPTKPARGETRNAKAASRRDDVTPLGFLKASRASGRDARFDAPEGEDALLNGDPDAVTELGFLRRPGGDVPDVGKKKGPGVDLDKVASRKMNEQRQRALRVISKWRKVHALYTLTKGGYGTVFIDAASVMIRDPTLLIKEEMKHNSLVTLSDFGGEKDQSLLNTGLLAAAPGKQTWDLLEDWIRTELYGQADEQEHLVYEIAPRAKEEGKKIHGMPHQMFPSYLTFYKGRLENIRTKHGDYAKYGDTAVVHAGYCGTVAGKKAFLDRVNKMDRLEMFSRHFGSNHGNWYNQHMKYKETDAERDGCDVHGRDKFRTCGKAPWDSPCDEVWADDADDLPELPLPPYAEAAVSEATRKAITVREASDIETTVMGISDVRKASGTAQIA